MNHEDAADNTEPHILPFETDRPARDPKELRRAMDSLLTRPLSRTFDELMEARRAGDISQFDFELNTLMQLRDHGEPLRRSDLRHATGEQALVMHQGHLFNIGGDFECITAAGHRVRYTMEGIDEDDFLILFPADLGEEEGKPRLVVKGE